MAQYQSFPGAAGDSRTLDKLKALRLPDLRGRRFLDVGCNEGFFCGFAHHQGASRVLGVDHSRQFIDRARKRFPGCEFLQQGWDLLPEGPFDTILLASALHYADDQSALIGRLVDRLSPDGVLILELGIVSSGDSEWVKVKRGIDERFFPTMRKLREVLADYAWKWMGPSISQAGDPVARHVLHVTRKRPMAYLLLEPPGYGKSSIAASLFPNGLVKVISGDERLDQAAKGKIPVGSELRKLLDEDYSPFTLDRIIGRVFDAGLGKELLELWLGELESKDFALEVYVPSAQQTQVAAMLVEAGYFPVWLKWDRVGPAAMPSEALVASAEAFYLSVADVDAAGGSNPTREKPAFQPIGFVDELSVKSRQLTVRGWAIDSQGNLPDRLLVRIAGVAQEVPAIEKQLRPDVQRHMSLPHALVGYRFTLPVDAESVEGLGEGFECTAPAAGGSPFRLATGIASRLPQAKKDEEM